MQQQIAAQRIMSTEIYNCMQPAYNIWKYSMEPVIKVMKIKK